MQAAGQRDYLWLAVVVSRAVRGQLDGATFRLPLMGFLIGGLVTTLVYLPILPSLLDTVSTASESPRQPGDPVYTIDYSEQDFRRFYGADWGAIYTDAEYRSAMAEPGPVVLGVGFPARTFRDVPQMALDAGVGGSDICAPDRPETTVLNAVRCFGGTLGDGNVIVFRRD